ncbi:hypothetical protein CR62_24125 [Serratia grimesii]|uniref:Uncharacterized protein n=1 Tax=Serratia grimesii TaxID=82995 RepID=A0ABR4UAE7_9GAMM|nr:hypothetical protein CR62_24125 [Serratia grimesii]
MEKITELSKPVVYAYRADANKRAKFDIPTSWQFGHSTICDGVAAEPPPLGDEYEYKPLYAQEYVSALLQRIAELEATEIKPEGMRLMSEAIGSHGYIVGCLVQGRPDLALEESRKWVDAFSQAAELIKNG